MWSEYVVLTTGAAVVVTLRAANKKNELSTETILQFKYLLNILKMKNSFNSLKLSLIKKESQLKKCYNKLFEEILVCLRIALGVSTTFVIIADICNFIFLFTNVRTHFRQKVLFVS